MQECKLRGQDIRLTKSRLDNMAGKVHLADPGTIFPTKLKESQGIMIVLKIPIYYVVTTWLGCPFRPKWTILDVNDVNGHNFKGIWTIDFSGIRDFLLCRTPSSIPEIFWRTFSGFVNGGFGPDSKERAFIYA